MLAPLPTSKLEDHPLSAVRDCLFNLFAATLHVGGRSSIRNLRTRHAVVTGTHKHSNNINNNSKMTTATIPGSSDRQWLLFWCSTRIQNVPSSIPTSLNTSTPVTGDDSSSSLTVAVFSPFVSSSVHMSSSSCNLTLRNLCS